APAKALTRTRVQYSGRSRWPENPRQCWAAPGVLDAPERPRSAQSTPPLPRYSPPCDRRASADLAGRFSTRKPPTPRRAGGIQINTAHTGKPSLRRIRADALIHKLPAGGVHSRAPDIRVDEAAVHRAAEPARAGS